MEDSASISFLLRRLSKNFTIKISEILTTLFNHKRASSLGAIAGFAIAVIFTWKFLRSPNFLQRNQRKLARFISSAANTNDIQTDQAISHVGHHSETRNLSEFEIIDEFQFQSEMKFTLQQIVKNKLHGGRKVTCRLLGVILEESTPEELQKHATVRPSVLEILLEIARFTDIYLMERILDDKSGERVLSALERFGLLKSGDLIRDKVLFCSTENGRKSFVRQIEPDWHIDSNPEIISHLSPFIPYELYISKIGTDTHLGDNVLSATTLEEYFS